MKATRAIRCAAALAVTLLATYAHATVVNINTRVDSNPYQQTLGSGVTLVGTVLTLGQGNYVITPLSANTGGIFTAANRFNQVSLPLRGWEWNYYIAIDGQPATKIGFGEGQPAAGGNYQATPDLAFALAPSHAFSLASTSSVTLFWADDNLSDNSGGISLDVSAAPGPVSAKVPFPTWSLVLLGCVLQLAGRRSFTGSRG